MIYFAVLNKLNQLIYSTIPENIDVSKIHCTETVFCECLKANRRQTRIKEYEFEFVLISYATNLTNKIFNHYIDALKLIAPLILKTNKEIVEKELKKTRRLKHNTISYTSKIQQELFKLIPQDTVAKGARNQISVIENIIAKDLGNSAKAYLKILKNVNFLKAEFAAYEMLNKEKGNIILDFQNHAIYKVIHLSLSSFWLDFIEKDVLVKIENCSKSLWFDYNSVTVSFSHIFDNAVRYICPNTEINISFKDEKETFIINIAMISLKIYPDEIDKIFNEEYSGRLADELELNGTGLGMNIIQNLLKLNAVEVAFKINTAPFNNIFYEKHPYEKNELQLIFKNSDLKSN